MRSLMRKVAVAGLSTALMTGVVFAGTPMPHHDRDDHSSFEGSSATSVVTKNDTDLFNMAMAELETGDNHADKNHQDGKVTTGAASGTINVSTTANKAVIKVTAPDACNDCGSEADKVEVKSRISVYTNNDVDLKNIVKVEAETGDNTAYHNGRDGVVTTGAASANITVSNTLNSSEVTVN